MSAIRAAASSLFWLKAMRFVMHQRLERRVSFLDKEAASSSASMSLLCEPSGS